MPTFTSPVTQAELQTYLRDSSTDTDLLAFYQSLLNTAAEYVYNWLDRDYTASATKSETFWGLGGSVHYTRNPVGTLTSWTYTEANNITTNPGTSDIFLRRNGWRLDLKTLTFVADAEHTITYQQPSTLTCPETVRQVITEIAAQLFIESNQGRGMLGISTELERSGNYSDRVHTVDLTPRHQEMLRPYRRLAT